MHAPLPRLANRLHRDQRGLTTVEYTIVLCLIAAIAVATWQSFGAKIETYLRTANDRIDGELAKPPPAPTGTQ